MCVLHGTVNPDGSVRIEQMEPIANRSVRADQFRVTFPDKKSVVGVLHSHPSDDRPVPSLADRKGIRPWMLGGVFYMHRSGKRSGRWSGRWSIYWFGSLWAEEEGAEEEGAEEE